MNGVRLKSLVIENFRSLRGKVAIPLDAQVVLIHGTNGMGKTSVLSAVELGLAGKISHLSSDGDTYKRYLTNLDAADASIALATTGGASNHDLGLSGSISITNGAFDARPALSEDDARFFAERCYLPQATLSRLLEIYNEQKASSTSPLTLFVKELLGLDPLDSLVDGLDPAFNVTRVRKLVPDFKRLESLKVSLQDQLKRATSSSDEVVKSVQDRRDVLNHKLAEIFEDASRIAITDTTDLSQLRSIVKASHDEDRRLVELARARSEVRALSDRWRDLPSEDTSRNQAEIERADTAATQTLEAWRAGSGVDLLRIVDDMRELFPDILPVDEDPMKGHSDALRRAKAEEARCTTLLQNHAAAAERVKNLSATVQRANARIGELNKDLAGAAEDAKTLANALAGIVPHINGERCPVCDRDFEDVHEGPLAAHVAAKIASLTSEAGRIQALATERAGESKISSEAQRELLSAGSAVLAPVDLAQFTVRQAQMADFSHRLRELAHSAEEGARLVAARNSVRVALVLARRRAELYVSLLPEIEAAVVRATGKSARDFPDVAHALEQAQQITNTKVSELEGIGSIRIDVLSDLDKLIGDVNRLTNLRAEQDDARKRLEKVGEALRAIDSVRDNAKKLSDAANTVRSEIVRNVFNDSLNKVWRDLFVRLAPSEQFVPAFRLPSENNGKVEAVLETLHRSGKISGTPGAILSQGNLNTAALTLFLALHLSVPARMDWLVLDDPVQSMDDVHIAQFAALLRTISKGLNKQVILAVHERALFDYLTLELSPASPGDSLITIEISRNFSNETVVTPQAFRFEEDRAIAA
jgi:exonuclease SbcC